MDINKLITKSVIDDYSPSQVNNYYTLLEQLEFIKQLLQKYPSTQFFYTSRSYAKTATVFASSNVTLNGRKIAVGDFIFSTITGTDEELGLWQVTGFSGSSIVVYYIGDLAKQGEKGERGEPALYPLKSLTYGDEKPVIGTGIAPGLDSLSREPLNGEYSIFPVKYATGTYMVIADWNKETTPDGRYLFRVKNFIPVSITATDVYSMLEGSESIVCDLNEDETAVEIHLDNDVINEITNSLKKPLTVAEPTLIAVDNVDGSVVQNNITVGRSLILQNNKLMSNIFVKQIILLDATAGEEIAYYFSNNETVPTSFQELFDDVITNTKNFGINKRLIVSGGYTEGETIYSLLTANVSNEKINLNFSIASYNKSTDNYILDFDNKTITDFSEILIYVL